MRLLSCKVILLSLLAIGACTPSPSPAATHTRATMPRLTTTARVSSPTPSQAAPPLTYPNHTGVSIRCPYPPCWYSQTPRPSDTFTPTPTLVARPGEPLDQTSAESVLEWLNYAISDGDISIFESLASPKIGYGPYASEGTGAYTKEQFLEQVGQRISVRPLVVSFEDYPGEIHALFVMTRGWFPAWEFDGFADKLVSNCVVFDFSDQTSKADGLYLHGVYTTTCGGRFPGTPFP